MTDKPASMSRRSVLLAAGAVIPSTLNLKVPEHRLAVQARSSLRRRFGETPPTPYIERFDLELGAIERRGLWPLLETAQRLVSAANDAGVVLVTDTPVVAGSLVAFALDLSLVDPVRRRVPADYLFNGDEVPSIDFLVSSGAPLDFLRGLDSPFRPDVEVRGANADTPERYVLSFPQLGPSPAVRIFRENRLDDLQVARDAGLQLDDLRLDEVQALWTGPLPPPFDTAETAWVAESFQTFEDVVTALGLMRAENYGRASEDEVLDWWRTFFAGGNGVPASCAPFIEGTHDLILYNEQVTRIARAVAGFSFEEAKKLRWALLSQRPDRMSTSRREFTARASQVSRIPARDAAAVFDFIARHCLLLQARACAVIEAAIWVSSARAREWLASRGSNFPSPGAS